ncbi:MAG TPA: gephyrin-like molybdotransferase Glp [Candidatus Krumholzibacteriaceae bacterium]|nr:gephyrin-like molybdotransferase Glp [Candidatus Krumholzibacteriaceae bacterium]
MSKMTPFKQLITYEEALERIRKHIKPVTQTETVSIEDALDRVLAEDITANISVPPFDRAAMDGYAVKAEDTYGASSSKPKNLKLVETLHADESSNRLLGTGECAQIATGSPIPRGADAVVMVEFTGRSDKTVSVLKPVYPGENISPKGEDIEEGRVILRAGDQLSAAKIGVLAALGKKEARAFVKPRVAVVPTGSEIQEIGSPLKEGQIYDVNSYTLTAVIGKNGAVPMKSKAVPDTEEELKKTIKKLLTYDMIVFSGGSSVGERDLLSSVVQDFGEVIFHGIQVKPGKPTLFALIDGKPVFGMPGYPTSCLSNAYLLLVPAIRQMARLPPRIETKVKARLAKRVISSSGRMQFLTVKLKDGLAYPAFKQSGAITSMAEADGYIILPINVDVVEEDQEVTVFLFD